MLEFYLKKKENELYQIFQFLDKKLILFIQALQNALIEKNKCEYYPSTKNVSLNEHDDNFKLYLMSDAMIELRLKIVKMFKHYLIKYKNIMNSLKLSNNETNDIQKIEIIYEIINVVTKFLHLKNLFILHCHIITILHNEINLMIKTKFKSMHNQEKRLLFQFFDVQYFLNNNKCTTFNGENNNRNQDCEIVNQNLALWYEKIEDDECIKKLNNELDTKNSSIIKSVIKYKILMVSRMYIDLKIIIDELNILIVNHYSERINNIFSSNSINEIYNNENTNNDNRSLIDFINLYAFKNFEKNMKSFEFLLSQFINCNNLDISEIDKDDDNIKNTNNNGYDKKIKNNESSLFESKNQILQITNFIDNNSDLIKNMIQMTNNFHLNTIINDGKENHFKNETQKNLQLLTIEAFSSEQQTIKYLKKNVLYENNKMKIFSLLDKIVCINIMKNINTSKFQIHKNNYSNYLNNINSEISDKTPIDENIKSHYSYNEKEKMNEIFYNIYKNCILKVNDMNTLKSRDNNNEKNKLNFLDKTLKIKSVTVALITGAVIVGGIIAAVTLGTAAMAVGGPLFRRLMERSVEEYKNGTLESKFDELNKNGDIKKEKEARKLLNMNIEIIETLKLDNQKQMDALLEEYDNKLADLYEKVMAMKNKEPNWRQYAGEFQRIKESVK
jgi:hypothetical protein